MGRETKFLLAVLGVLVGAFVGVLSMKLLVPRPPAGAGPDVDPQHLSVTGQDIVEPPALEPRGGMSAFTAKQDPFLRRTEFSEPISEAPAEVATPVDSAASADFQPASPATPPSAATPRDDSADMPPPAFEASSARVPIVGTYVTTAGDTWWSIAERAYGDGRLYRALYAWNRRVDPRASTIPGTRLEIPPQPKLAAAWRKLMP